MADIPEVVLEELEEVRASGATNMFARDTVISLVMEVEAADWLLDNKDRYMEALNAMGARRSASG